MSMCACSSQCSPVRPCQTNIKAKLNKNNKTLKKKMKNYYKIAAALPEGFKLNYNTLRIISRKLQTMMSIHNINRAYSDNE